MKTRYFFLLAAAALLAGCAKEMQEQMLPEENAPAPFYLEVGTAPQTLTSMGSLEGSLRKVYWANGDKIRVSNQVSEELTGLEANTKSSTVFTFNGGEPSTPYNVLYPSSIYVDGTHVNLPAVQGYRAGGFANNALPMAGYSADGTDATIHLSHLCAIVKISVKRASSGEVDADNIAAVRFRGRNNEQVSGNVTITYSASPALAAESAENDVEKEVRVVKTLATSTSTAIYYYLVVPAREYANGFDIIVQDVNGHIMTKSKTSSWTPVAGHLYNMPEFEFVPTGTELGVTISNAAEFVSFAQRYNNGDYVPVGENLLVTLTADIDFSVGTANSDFATTKGIGTRSGEFGTTVDNYFLGTFNGNNHTISNYAANIPLFKYTRTATVIKNFTVDNTCSYTFTHDNDAEGRFGAVVGYHKGTLKDVTVNANLTLADAASIAQHAAIGGIVGNLNNGTIKDCVFAGNISVPSGFVITATNKKILLGGIAGYISNEEGKIQGSDFNGTICNEGQVAKGNQTTPLLVIGGIVAYSNGKVDDCETTDHPTVNSAYTSDGGTTYLKGTIVNKTVSGYCTTVGGIVGENLANGVVSNSTNAATIVNTMFIDKSTNDDNGRRLRVGGIVGINRASAKISDCSNSGSILHRSNVTFQYVGGIAGQNQGIVTSCSNGVAHSIMSAETDCNSARYLFFGGVIGENETATVTDISNTEQLTVEMVEASTSTYVRFGGAIGSNLAAIDGGVSKKIKNSGKVYYNANMSTNAAGYYVGGVVGYSEASVENASNSGYVHFNWASTSNLAKKVHLGGIVGYMNGNGTISGCTNTGGASNAGEVNLAVKNGSGGHTDNYAGGILGYTAKDVTISNCTNSGYVHGGNSNKVNSTSCFMGGIAAYLAGASSISGCTNSANVGNVQFTNTVTNSVAAYTGGIVGYVKGTDAARITISDCEQTTTALEPKRGYLGGIVGYALYTDISDCDVSVNLNGTAWYPGGIAGWLVNSSANGCAMTGTTITNQQIRNAGGIVAKLDTGSTIDGCSSSVSTIYCVLDTADASGFVAAGALAGSSVAGTTIENCHYPASGTITYGNSTGTTNPTWQICGDTNWSGTGNVAD